MSVYIVSDLHGAVDDLRKAVPEGAAVVLLGDLINFLDYFSMTGILTEVFSVETVARVVQLRTAGRVEEARRVMHERSAGREEEIGGRIGRLVVEEYRTIFAALPDPSFVILGNVDTPVTAADVAVGEPALHWVDGTVVSIDGERFGFVGGALPTPIHAAGEVSAEEMRSKIDALGDCDVLCSHIPPAVPELCFDTVARRSERGSDDLLRYILDVQPRVAYFGHIHQPLVSSLHVGRTLCLNVGYFRATRRAWLHRPDPIPG